MTREETAQVLTILRISYPNFYSKMPKADMGTLLSLWSGMFEQDDFTTVQAAVKNLIETHSGYPPDIAEIKKRIKELVAVATGEDTPEELWKKLKHAIREGAYSPSEEFDKLPKSVQTYIGSPGALVEYGMMESTKINDYIRTNFMKDIVRIQEREVAEKKMPPALREAIKKCYGEIAGDRKPLLESEVNERRNHILDQLEGLK